MHTAIASFPRRFGFGCFWLALVCACSSEKANEVGTSSSPAAFTSAQPGVSSRTKSGGIQYVAIAGGMKNTVTQQTDSGPAWVAILSLPKQ